MEEQNDNLRKISIVFSPEEFADTQRVREKAGMTHKEVYILGAEHAIDEVARIDCIEGMGGYVQCYVIWRMEKKLVRDKLRISPGRSTKAEEIKVFKIDYIDKYFHIRYKDSEGSIKAFRMSPRNVQEEVYYNFFSQEERRCLRRETGVKSKIRD